MKDRPNPLLPAARPDPDPAIPALEEEVLERWRANGVFKRSLERRQGAQPWVFYEGPPTANGPPGAHHVLSRVFKDIYPRFQTMRGRYVERKGGWDCHGLPVEIAVEQELGLRSKGEIEEKVGVEAFNARCRETVFSHVKEWNRLTERIGFWVDLDDAYRTMDESYIESVWWALAELYRRGLLYESYKVVPYCFRCQTALSAHELALGYKEVEDRTAYVLLPLLLEEPRTVTGAGAEVTFEPGDSLLIWTTTPWTLPGNLAVAASPDLTYLRARLGRSHGAAAGRVVVVAKERAVAALGEDHEPLQAFPGSLLFTGGPLRYRGLGFRAEQREGVVIPGSFITTEEGTGLVHIAPAFGQEDFEAAAAAGLIDPTDPGTVPNPVSLAGTYDPTVRSLRDQSRDYGGRLVKEKALEEELLSDLQAAGLLLRVEPYLHPYPHCWRCENPLIYLAKASWYIRTSAMRDELLAANETVNWYPAHVKHGRFGEWLRNNVDWALSRERYWGTPLPVWRCPAGHLRVVGSFKELEELSGVTLADHHRPYVDLSFPCPEPGCSEQMDRVEEVIDVWFDSGAMPFAQFHYPFERQDLFQQRFPADFICEALDQTRGWFYSLLAVSTLLYGRAPYRNVVCLGLILDAEGQKMSKSRGNAVEPWEVIDRYGADAFRWYLFTAKAPWDGYRFSLEAIGEQVRLFLRPLYNALHFYALYAQANSEALAGADPDTPPANDLDRWILSRTASVCAAVIDLLEHYDATTAGRHLADLLDDLSNWYIRRSRRRFWDGEPAAFATLRRVLLTFARLLAPFCPFAADYIYLLLDGSEDSVHLCDFPDPAQLQRDPRLEEEMEVARRAVRLGLAARAQQKVKLRQPLSEAVVVAQEGEREALARLAEIVREELNVKELRLVAAEEELGSYQLKPNYRTLGPRFGKLMPKVASAVAALPGAEAVAALRDQGWVEIEVEGERHRLAREDLLVSVNPPEGFAVEREGGFAVFVNLALDDRLLAEGRAREVVRAVQNARRNAGLEVVDRIRLALGGDRELLEAVRSHATYLAEETLATDLVIGEEGPDGYDHTESLTVEGLALRIALSRAGS